MALIIHIDTATALASVSLAEDGKLIAQRINTAPMDHASWTHTAINELIRSATASAPLADLKPDAIAVVAGPGSYTGLRVGMATAKGLCYAWQIPLLTLNTLTLLAHASVNSNPAPLHCPMLDARRMEVFTAVYNRALKEEMPAQALVLDAQSFRQWLDRSTVVFSGDGIQKWKTLVAHPNAIFSDAWYSPEDITRMAYQQFLQKQFADLAYAEPIYLKEFYTTQKAIS